jgi:nucleoside 2-deoxyribosyltransferase
LYLAGPIFQCFDHECVDWRKEIKRLLHGYNFFDTMDRDYRGVTDQFVNEIVEGDKEDIDKADILLVNFVKPSVGTSMEILYAWERKKEVLVVTENNQISPWLIYHSTKIFKNIQEVVDYLKSSKGEDNG